MRVFMRFYLFLCAFCHVQSFVAERAFCETPTRRTNIASKTSFKSPIFATSFLLGCEETSKSYAYDFSSRGRFVRSTTSGSSGVCFNVFPKCENSILASVSLAMRQFFRPRAEARTRDGRFQSFRRKNRGCPDACVLEFVL